MIYVIELLRQLKELIYAKNKGLLQIEPGMQEMLYLGISSYYAQSVKENIKEVSIAWVWQWKRLKE